MYMRCQAQPVARYCQRTDPGTATRMTTPVLRVAIVEDDRATREGLKLLVDSTPGFSCVGTFHSAEDALRADPF